MADDFHKLAQGCFLMSASLFYSWWLAKEIAYPLGRAAGRWIQRLADEPLPTPKATRLDQTSRPPIPTKSKRNL